MSAHHRAGREDGLSLVEMMVGILIVGLVLAALASSLVTALRAVRGQEATTQATAAVNDILEEAQRVGFDQAALCDSTAPATFGGTTFEGEDLILSSSVCGAADEVLPERTVTRDGRDYDVTTAITWSDDPGDDNPTDPDGPQDVKRIVVDVAWTSDGQARTARNIAYRAPQFQEQLITAELVVDDGSEFVQIADGAELGVNQDPFTVRVHAREKLTSVKVIWTKRDGTKDDRLLVEKSANVWEYHMGVNFGPFANGATLFTFQAVAESGETEEVATRGLFLYDPMVLNPNEIQKNFTKILVNQSDGTVCPGQRLWVDVQGAIRSDVVQATWLKGPDPAVPDSLVSVDAPAAEAERGARFELDLSNRTDFSTDNGDGTYSIPGNNQVRVSVTRIVDSATIDKELDNSVNMEMVPTC